MPLAALPVSSFYLLHVLQRRVTNMYEHRGIQVFLPVTSVAKSIEIPFNVSFSVANGVGIFTVPVE